MYSCSPIRTMEHLHFQIVTKIKHRSLSSRSLNIKINFWTNDEVLISDTLLCLHVVFFTFFNTQKFFTKPILFFEDKKTANSVILSIMLASAV